MADHKDIAVEFLKGVVSGNIGDAYSQYVRKDMRHHNPYFKGDAASLEQGMLENHEQFPNKSIDIKHVFEAGDLVATHSLVRLDPSTPGIAAVHILRFEGNMIAEMWDIAQEIPKNMPNENGMF